MATATSPSITGKSSLMAAVMLLAVSGLLASCSRHFAPDPGASGDFSQKNTATPMNTPLQFKAVTFNLFNRPWQRAARLENADATLRAIDADVVLLQEVAKGWILGQVDPAQRLAESLQMQYVRYWHEENLGIFRTGLAVLSRFPILSSEYHEFKSHPFWDAKGYMLVTLELPGGSRLQLINLHMASTTHDAIREDEWAELSEFVARLQRQGAVLIGGDFNTEATHPALAKFSQQLKTSNLYEHEVFRDIARWRSWTPSYRETIAAGKFSPDSQLIDYFFAAPAAASAPDATSKLQFTGGRIVLPPFTPRPSDHLPVVAELQLAAPIKN